MILVGDGGDGGDGWDGGCLGRGVGEVSPLDSFNFL